VKWSRTAIWIACLLGASWCAGQTPSPSYPPSPEPSQAGEAVPLQATPWPAPAAVPTLQPDPLSTPPADPLGLPQAGLVEAPVPDPLIIPLPDPTATPLPGQSLSMPIREYIEGKPEKPPPKIWDGNMELGVNGTDGNTETLNIRIGGKVRRKTEANEFKTDITYLRTSSNSVETANRGLGDFRYEHFFADSPWTVFSHANLEYDEFQAWNARLGLDAGMGYRFIKTDDTTLTGRLGAGTSRKFGGDDLEWKPEAVFGAEFDHKISNRQKISMSTDYRPSFDDWGDSHMVTKASWQAMLDDASRLSLKLSATDRYNSIPQGRKPNDVDYGITLLWAF
jgi:putative salt-induced outer membrane protein YdiY